MIFLHFDSSRFAVSEVIIPFCFLLLFSDKFEVTQGCVSYYSITPGNLY